MEWTRQRGGEVPPRCSDCAVRAVLEEPKASVAGVCGLSACEGADATQKSRSQEKSWFREVGRRQDAKKLQLE